MEIIKLKNNQDVADVWYGITIEPGEYYQVQSDYERVSFETSQKVIEDIQSDPPKLIVNDGVSDLSAALGVLYLQKRVNRVHNLVSFNPAVGETAPAVTLLNGAAFGYEMEVGDRLFTVVRFDNIVGEDDYFDIHHHACIDNDQEDRWIQWKAYVISTNGYNAKIMTEVDQVVEPDPMEVPTTPNQIFKYTFNIPTALLTDGRDYLFIGFERVVAIGKTAPDNNVMVFRVDEVHYKNLEKD